MELRVLGKWFIVGVVYLIASWLLGYLLSAILYPLWLVAITGGAILTLVAIILGFIVLAIATGWLVLTVARIVGGAY